MADKEEKGSEMTIVLSKTSIAVTLGRIDWNWSAEAIRPPEQVTSDSGSDPQLYDDDAFPEWVEVKPAGNE